jgi:hypothetical protein
MTDRTRGRGRIRRSRSSNNKGGEIDIRVELKDAIEEYDQVAERVEKRLSQAGVKMPVRPMIPDDRGGDDVPYDGMIPDDLDALNDQEIGIYLSAATRWYDYVGRLVAGASRDSEKASQAVKDARSFLRKRIMEEREGEDDEDRRPSTPKWQDDDQIETYPEMIKLKAMEIEAKSYHEYLKRAYEAAENNRRALSKQANLREGQHRAGNRDENVQDRRRQSRAHKWTRGRPRRGGDD